MTRRSIYFVRHGQTEWNKIRRMQGQWNSNLDEVGRAQAEAHGRLLTQFELDALYCSPLDRTRQTVQKITDHVALPVAYDARIKEWDCGDWSGHMYADLPERWPEAWAAWNDDPYRNRPPGGESYPDMFARARPFLEDLQALPLNRIAIVSHGLIGRVMIACLLDLNQSETLGIRQPNDVVFRITLEGDVASGIHHYQAGNGPIEGLHIGNSKAIQAA